MRDHVALASANAREDVQASSPLSLLWLTSMAQKCSSRTGRPLADARHKRRGISQFANHLRRRRGALSSLTAMQYVSNILLRVSCRLRALGAAWRVNVPAVVACLRLTTGKSLYFRLSASEPLKWRCHPDKSTHDRACFSGI